MLSVMKKYNFGDWFDDWVYKHHMFCCFIQHVVHKYVFFNIVFCKKIIMFSDLEVFDDYRVNSDNTHPSNQNPMIKRNRKHKKTIKIFFDAKKFFFFQLSNIGKTNMLTYMLNWIFESVILGATFSISKYVVSIWDKW